VRDVTPQLEDSEGRPVATSADGSISGLARFAGRDPFAIHLFSSSNSMFECEEKGAPKSVDDAWTTDLPFPISFTLENTHLDHLWVPETRSWLMRRCRTRG
jgi:hypothetical protein